MIKYKFHFLICILFTLVYVSNVWSEEFISPECLPLELAEETYSGPEQYAKGLLWKVNKTGISPSYIFGTIHVADGRITNLPDIVSKALNNSNIFVMEALPDPTQALALYSMMFFSDGKKLTQFTSTRIYEQVLKILSAYHISDQVVSIMKPWAAYLTMNYPPDMGTVPLA